MSTGAQVRLIPPVVYFVPFTVMWALHWRQRWTIPGGVALTVAGLTLVIIGLALSVWTVWAFARAHTTVIPWEHVSAMVTTGPFRISRNPIYLSDAIAYLGGTLILHSWWPLLVLPGILWVIRRRVIDREELYLTGRFGDAYRQYQLRVRRWI